MRLIILGAGGYGQTVADLARQSGRYEQVSFLDDNAAGLDVIGKCGEFTQFRRENVEMYPAFGNNQGRLEWLDKLTAAGIRIASIVHPTAYVSPSAVLEEGCMVLPTAVVNTSCIVKRGCIINCGAIIDHGCVLGECVHVCLGAIVKAENHIPVCMKIEAGQVIENRTYL